MIIKVFLEGEGLNVGLYDGVVGNPVRSQVIAGVESYRSHGADAVVASVVVQRWMLQRLLRLLSIIRATHLIMLMVTQMLYR